jgi:hypothetical protein
MGEWYKRIARLSIQIFVATSSSIVTSLSTKAHALASKHSTTPEASAKGRILNRSFVLLIALNLPMPVALILVVNFLQLLRFCIISREWYHSLHLAHPSIKASTGRERDREGFTHDRAFVFGGISHFGDVGSPVLEAFLNIFATYLPSLEIGLQSQ